MKSKKSIVMCLSALLIFSLSSFGESTKLKQIGRYTLVRIKGEVPTAEVMKILLDRYTGDIKYGFDTAGYGDLFLPFIEQLRTASFEETELAVGDKVMWMLFRSRGKVKVAEDVEWAGEKPLPVFSFIVKKDFKHYEFVMPKPCGNISLRKVEEIIPDAVCNIRVDPVKANINDPISVNMSGSLHAKSMEVEVFNSLGTKIAAKTLTPDSSKWQTKFDTHGEYVFKAKAINLEGKASTNLCEAKTYINAPPTCNLWTTCLPCKDYVGKPITFDASKSTDPDGEVVKADFEIRDAAGNIVDTYSAGMPFSWDKTFAKPGVYTITVVVADDFGALSQPCELDVEVTQKRLFFLLAAGPLLARGTYTTFFFAQAGLYYEIVPDKWSFMLSAGPAFPSKGKPWKTFFMADALLNYHAAPAFIGAGLGYSTKDHENKKSGLDVVGNVGFDVFTRYSTIGQLFFEGRLPIGADRPVENNYKLLLGFRLLL